MSRRRLAGPRIGNFSTTHTAGAHTSSCRTQDTMTGGKCDCRKPEPAAVESPDQPEGEK